MTTPAPDTTTPRVRSTASGAIRTACRERNARQEWLNRLLQLLDTPWQCVKRRAARIARQRELSALDDRALKDLAISRNDLAAIANGAFFVDPTRRQRSAAQANSRNAP